MADMKGFRQESWHTQAETRPLLVLISIAVKLIPEDDDQSNPEEPTRNTKLIPMKDMQRK
jgi:hypothetical protein